MFYFQLKCITPCMHAPFGLVIYKYTPMSKQQNVYGCVAGRVWPEQLWRAIPDTPCFTVLHPRWAQLRRFTGRLLHAPCRPGSSATLPQHSSPPSVRPENAPRPGECHGSCQHVGLLPCGSLRPQDGTGAEGGAPSALLTGGDGGATLPEREWGHRGHP